MKKWIFTICLVLALVLSAAACAEIIGSGECGDNVTFTVDDTGTMTVSGTGPMAFYCEETDGGYSLWSPPFWSWQKGTGPEETRRQIKKIVVEKGVTTVGAGAFRDLDGLEEVVLPESVTSIGAFAFDNDTALKKINIPGTVTEIRSCAFENNTSLETITIPAGVTYLGDRVFYEDTALQNIRVDSSNTAYKSVDGVLFTKDGKVLMSYCPGRTDSSYAIPDGVQTVMPSAFSYSASLQEVTFPDTVTELRNWAFGHTGLKKVVLPQNLAALRYCVFGGCELEEVSIPLSLKTVEEWAFGGGPLTTVYYEGSEKQWGEIEISSDNDALKKANIIFNFPIYVHCDHPSIVFHSAVPHTCTEDGTLAYWECEECGRRFQDAKGTVLATDLTDPARHHYVSSITELPNCSETGTITYTCTECDAQTEGHSYTVEIAATREHHFTDGFCDNILHDGSACGVQEEVAGGTCGETMNWKLDGSGTLVISGTGSMDNYRITSTTVYAHGSPLYTNRFLNTPWCSHNDEIKAVIIEEGVGYVGNLAFAWMKNAAFIRLPASLTGMGTQQMFNDNGSLKDIYYYGTEATWRNINLESTLNFISNHNITMHYVPASSGECGTNAAWSVDDSGTLTISGSGAVDDYMSFSGDQKFTFTAPPWNAWESEGGNGELPRRILRVVVKKGITSIGNGAFLGLPWLEEVEIPASVTSIGTRAFWECNSLKKITVNASNANYKSVGGVLFTKDGKELVSYCPGLADSSYTVPDGVRVIHPSAFYGAETLKEVRLPAGLEEIGFWAFGNTGLTYAEIPEGVRTIEYCAFCGCGNMGWAVLPASLTAVGDNAFAGCRLGYVEYTGTEAQWKKLGICEGTNPELLGANVVFATGETRTLNLPEKLEQIGESAFENGTFTHVYLGDKVTAIGSKAFAGCGTLKLIRIPASCTDIAEDAFSGCLQVMFECPADSAARQFAEAHGIRWKTGTK